jgi:hypothetical protein
MLTIRSSSTMKHAIRCKTSVMVLFWFNILSSDNLISKISFKAEDWIEFYIPKSESIIHASSRWEIQLNSIIDMVHTLLCNIRKNLLVIGFRGILNLWWIALFQLFLWIAFSYPIDLIKPAYCKRWANRNQRYVWTKQANSILYGLT